jgi:hypothetical protein
MSKDGQMDGAIFVGTPYARGGATNSAFCPHSVFTCSLNSINRLGVVMETECVS